MRGCSTVRLEGRDSAFWNPASEGREKRMSSWLNRVLFGRQLSHGSDNENPQTFEEALPTPSANVVDLQQAVRSLEPGGGGGRQGETQCVRIEERDVLRTKFGLADRALYNRFPPRLGVVPGDWPRFNLPVTELA